MTSSDLSHQQAVRNLTKDAHRLMGEAQNEILEIINRNSIPGPMYEEYIQARAKIDTVVLVMNHIEKAP